MPDEPREPSPREVADFTAWIQALEGACPICGSNALRLTGVHRQLALTAASEHGIDTSDEVDVFDSVCDDCGFDRFYLEVDVVERWAESRR